LNAFEASESLGDGSELLMAHLQVGAEDVRHVVDARKPIATTLCCYVPLTTRLAATLRDYRHLRGPLVLYQDNGSPLTEGLVQRFVRRAAQKAGLFNNGPHMLRHTFCSHLAMRGAPAQAIQELAGHQDLTTTQRYMHLSPAALDNAIRLLESPGMPHSFGDIVETEKGQRRSRLPRTG
jgi:site-specific recombinase XerC